MDAQRSYEDENDPFETIETEKDNQVRREFEIGEPGNKELQEDELTRNERGQGATRNNKPSQRKF